MRGATTGQYNELASAVFTTTRNGQLRITEEHSVLSSDHNIEFFRPGDSGSFFFTHEGNMVGMGFGGQLFGRITVFTRVDDLVADIKRETGAAQIILYGEERP
ncbi:hypothetical protein BDV28DRAFT_41969 [Aspergillus coremiiformis]|uniref:Uncharacterized protein n=1 Tax=Aspergillus coremiiformis TaxID=138285 RepID=A0A5N6ZJA7_9EURO|nr:hypothetical protein BDV28DRAFT_41969 [Aspergillus coremiiformis]